jgi:hypothetical protein
MALTLLLVGCGGESPQPTAGTAPAGNRPAAPLAEEIDPVRRAREALRERRLVSPMATTRYIGIWSRSNTTRRIPLRAPHCWN